MKKKNHNDPNPKYKFKKCDDPFEDAKVEAMKARKGQWFRTGVPNTLAAQGLLGLRKYAEEWWLRAKHEGILGAMFHTKNLFMDWYGDNPRPGNCVLVRIDPKEKATPHNVKYCSYEAHRTVTMLRRYQKHTYFGVVWDPGVQESSWGSGGVSSGLVLPTVIARGMCFVSLVVKSRLHGG